MCKKTIISLALIFSILVGGLFVFLKPTQVYADTVSNNTVVYDTDTTAVGDTSVFGNYAIDSIESLTINGTFVYKTVFTPRTNYTLTFLDFFVVNNSYYGNLFILNLAHGLDSQFDCNFAIRCLTSETGLRIQSSSTSYGSINGIGFYYRYIHLYANQQYELYFSTLCFSGTYNNLTVAPSIQSNIQTSTTINATYFNKVINSTDLSSFIDMSSSTNFSMNDFSFMDFVSTNSLKFSNFLSKFFIVSASLNQTLPSCSFSASQLSAFSVLLDRSKVSFYCSLYKGSSQVSLFCFDYFLSASSNVQYSSSATRTRQKGVYFKDFYFLINRPVYRTNNSLVLYNYDYDNFLSKVSSVTYQLQKNDTKYNIVYNGTLPNSYFILVSNEKINNMIFDKYIYLYFNFKYDLNSVIFDDSFVSVKDYSFGFDFNFTYYTNPLVTSNGSFNYKFEKPSYVDMPFSLVPFYLPVLEAVENALIFLMFYCPVSSHILAFIHLDEFFGSLFKVFNFSNSSMSVLGVNLGSFLWSCIAFIIFFKLLQSFMPIVWSSVAGTSKNTLSGFGRLKDSNYRYKQRVALERRAEHERALKRKLFISKERALREMNDFREKHQSKRNFIKSNKSKMDNLYDNLDNLDL